jgi:esterase/lipase superfamily enzyme
VAAIHVIAHSMGNRALTEAFTSLAGNSNLIKQGIFSEIIQAAPDINVDIFRQLAGAVCPPPNARRITLVRRTMRSRAGECITITPGIDVIDATVVDTSFLGTRIYYIESGRDMRS